MRQPIDRRPAGLSEHLKKIARLRENDPFVDFDLDEVESDLPTRFARIAASFPDQIAIRQNGIQITYQELNRISNRIARHLLHRIGRRREPVLLLLEHGLHQLEAIIGTVKSGNFYTNLNPHDPLTRLQQIKTDLGSSILLADSRHHALARQLVSSSDLLLEFEEIVIQGSDDASPGASPP